MAKITIITVGKKHSKEIKPLIDLYEKRLKKMCDLAWDIIPSSNIDSESLAIDKRLTADDFVILLDETGDQLNNDELAEKLEDLQNTSVKRIVFIIGGAYGVNYNLMIKANLVFSISKLVLPHQLVRVVLVEQIYRSFSILKGTKYHHE
jgi:23S rRNA (pseudouridine1915-N3)-methyltransferase